jgi:glycosyltransferase involved in cell wall biosynthesis
MHVCIEIQAGVAQRAGVGRYAKCLAEHLGAAADGDRLSLFYFDFRRRAAPFAAPQAEHRAVRWLPGRLVQKAWQVLAWPPFDWLAGPADLYHFTNFIRPPLARGKSVVTIHDLIFLRHPETVERQNYRYLTARIAATTARADAIIAISAFTAGELKDLLRVPQGKIFPIHVGLEPQWRRPAADTVAAARRRYGLARPYLLSVGTLEPRKNFALLIDVFERLADFDGELVIAGMRGWKCEPLLARMRASPRAAAIRWLDYVPDADLPALYAGAELFVFPSLYEGFGFTPLEAMACGTPVLASAGGALPEVLGDAARIIAGYEPDEWRSGVAELLSDSAQRAALIAKGQARAARYSWAETARRTWEVYRKVGA